MSLRVCIVCGEFLGPFRNGGIGTAYTRLAELLTEAGQDVTLLYANGRFSLTQPVEYWIEHYRARGMRFVPLPDSPIELRSRSYFLQVAYRVYLWMKSNDEFDLVHFAECAGYGYYALSAKHQGLLLQDATTLVGLHSSSEWIRTASGHLASSESELDDDFIERRSAELADVVWSPSRYMLDWVRDRGWSLACPTHVRPLIVRQTSQGRPADRQHAVGEVVFFGRLETRKGLFLFFDALERLARSLDDAERRSLIVTFLGKPTTINGQDAEAIIRERCRDWPFEVRILPDRDEREALDYLRGEGRLAVVPSLIENYPNTVLECLSHGIPFLASRVGGIPEQIAVEDQERVCVAPEAGALAARLLEVVRGGHAPARLAFDPRENDREWLRWHNQVHEQGKSQRAERDSVSRSTLPNGPTLSIRLASFGRPARLRNTLASLLNQVEVPPDVIVISFAGPADADLGEFGAIEREFDFEQRGWRLIHAGGRRFGAELNRAAIEAKGDYLLFIEEGAVVLPQALATFAETARHTAADALTGLVDVSAACVDADATGRADYRRLFSGANLPLSFLQNTFGDCGAFFHRAAFLAVDGFSADLEPGREDWELCVRLMLAGYQIEAIPEPLFFDGRERAGAAPTKPSLLRALRSHLERLPRVYHPLLEFTLGQCLAPRAAAAPWTKEAASPEEACPPLRHRVVDALNLKLKRIRWIHQTAKGLVHGSLRARRGMTVRLRAVRGERRGQ